MLSIRRESVLNLTLEGSIGCFRVKTGVTGQESLEVKYLLTYVGLNFATSSNDALLSSLAPVRELFDFASLDFDEIMQRDIDDARVSAELIPYLLDEHAREMIKLFPPVVVVVLPVEEGQNRPADYYPAVSARDLPPAPPNQYPLRVLRSGTLGAEVFQFEQPVVDGVPLNHDLARLRLNTHRTRMVIVDGQHRAMALLAIYRNLKDQWSDARRAPFREYYSEWTANYIQQFNLIDLNLPVMLCTVPSLDVAYQGDYDLKRAARSIFLTLNKTARKVSDSRNKLLDDNDLISFFMRRTLSEIKRKDTRSSRALRIWNVELDQFGDKQRLQSQIAITGVNHLYYITEHLMLDSGDTRGIAPRSGRFAARVVLDDCLERLDGRNLLGAETADTIRRDRFSAESAELLGKNFDIGYGNYIISAFEQFEPYEIHNRAVLQLEQDIEANQDRQMRPILFDGQGIGQVFETHRQNLKEKLRENYFHTDVPQIKASADRLDATATRIESAIQTFRADRATRFIGGVNGNAPLRNGAGEAHPNVVRWLNELFDNVLTTVAFECALIGGFFGEYERALGLPGGQSLDRAATFTEYITQLNEFFCPKTVPRFKKLLQVFNGELSGNTAADWKFAPSNQTFRNVVYRGEMNPDQWPKYKYLLLEIWQPTNLVLKASVEEERDRCRKEAFSALHATFKSAYCREQMKLEENLDKAELDAIFKQTLDAYNGLLKHIGANSLNSGAMKQAISNIPASAATQTQDPGV